MAKPAFNIMLSKTISNKHTTKELEIMNLDKGYMVMPRDQNLFLKLSEIWKSDFSVRNKTYQTLFYFQKGSAIVKAQKLNKLFNTDIFVAKEMSFTAQDQITLKTLSH